jgi:[NiFe] hydrogenase diaphorase moiety large subunit
MNNFMHRLGSILAQYENKPELLVQILREIQNCLGYVPSDVIDYLSASLKVPRAQVEATVSFYSFLHLQPAGKFHVLFSDNITDRMSGSQALMDRLCRNLWIEPGKIAEDRLVSADFTSCTGMCDQGPGLLINGQALTRMSEDRIDHISELIRKNVPLAEWPQEYFIVDDNVRRRDVLLGGCWVPGAAVQAAIARGCSGMLAELKISSLRGRGGAGFPAALKWESAHNAPVTEEKPERYIVCNADEGEPGTFKDRVLLSRHADLVFDGMTVAGYTIGASKGLVYLRGEYRYLLPKLIANLEQRRRSGLLGPSVCGLAGFNFDIDIHLGAGAYICGEETALIESLEGKPGLPRVRPPFPVSCGYLGQPTLVHNVETLCHAALIAQNGGAWFARIGTKESPGTKLISISGDVETPGVYEYPFGVSIERVLYDCGSANVQAVQIGGPSGACLTPHEFSRQIAFEDVPTAGAFMVFGGERDMFEVARHSAHFFAHESCGFCTPCRVGTTLVANLMDKIARGYGSRHDMDEILSLYQLMHTTSHCGLGQSACNPIVDTYQKFRQTYDDRLQSLDFSPAFDLEQSVAKACQLIRRDHDVHCLGQTMVKKEQRS